MTIGILALQGGYAAHQAKCQSLGAKTCLVRKKADLNGVSGLVIPGGESSTLIKLFEQSDLQSALAERLENKLPVFGTCAGAILLADNVSPQQFSFNCIDISIERNAYGRQRESMLSQGESELGNKPIERMFIRAPKITRVGQSVKTLVMHDGMPVAVKNDHILLATFHPELTEDISLHQHFLTIMVPA